MKNFVVFYRFSKTISDKFKVAIQYFFVLYGKYSVYEPHTSSISTQDTDWEKLIQHGFCCLLTDRNIS